MRRPWSILRPHAVCAPVQHFKRRIRLQLLFLYWSKLAASIVIADKNSLVTLESEGRTYTGETLPKAVNMPHAHSHPCTSMQLRQGGDPSSAWALPAGEQLVQMNLMLLGRNYDVQWHMKNCHWIVFTLLYLLFTTAAFEIQSKAKNWLYIF